MLDCVKIQDKTHVSLALGLCLGGMVLIATNFVIIFFPTYFFLTQQANVLKGFLKIIIIFK